MADLRHSTDGPSPSSPEGYDASLLPDYDVDFLPPDHLHAFATALSAPDHPSPSTDDLLAQGGSGLTSRGSVDAGAGGRSSSASRKGSWAGLFRRRSSSTLNTVPMGGGVGGVGERGVFGGAAMAAGRSRESLFISAQNDWAPVTPTKSAGSGSLSGLGSGSGSNATAGSGSGAAGAGTSTEKARRGREGRKRDRERRRKVRRSSDETREGYLYTLLAWPLLGVVGAWITGLGVSYLATRLYIWLYEHFVAWRGKRQRLRKKLYETENYADWVREARQLDRFLGNETWKEVDEYAYYDHKTVHRVVDQLKRFRRRVEAGAAGEEKGKAVEDLKALVEACAKNNFVGVENSRLYSQTYYGTKNLVQEFVDEVEKGVSILAATDLLPAEEKRSLFKRMQTNFGRTALCLSGGASFAYYHYGVVKALLDADLLPEVITGTSGGALVAALVATHTNEELKQLLVPALAGRITACYEPFTGWIRRWWRTGARFDSLDWAKKCSWHTRGSMTFREAYERTGRILNVSCVPADPHSPTILANYITSPDCVIWSAVIASAAVPGILNPVVLMMKNRDGSLSPYSFGHKWKDGSLRTDIPLKALNIHFNVNFSIVSQVNPHINLFFFSSRGSVGQPVTHRKGRGWRGGFLGSATEQYLKLDLNKWLKVVRHLELLPRPMGQDWSEIWLQQFSGTITIWPRSRLSDFWHILDDPDPKRLARMLHVGQQSAFPKLKFLGNRMRVERAIERGRKASRRAWDDDTDDDFGVNIANGNRTSAGETETEGFTTEDEHEHEREGREKEGLLMDLATRQ